MACAFTGYTQSLDSATTVTETTEEKKPFVRFSGSADIYYKYNAGQSAANNYTSFTGSHNSFMLGMASIKAEHEGDKVSMVIDLGFGPRARDFAYADEGITQAIKQLYISYTPVSWLTLTAGTWATHVGYELVDPQLNRNYSMSYMFTNGPFTHTGIKAAATKGKSSLMVGISNATDYRLPADGAINRKYLIAQYSFTATEHLKCYLNYVGGTAPDTSKSSQIDLVINEEVNDIFSIGYNGTISSTRAWYDHKSASGRAWWGSAIYLNLDPRPWFGLTLRSEYFNDKNQLKIPTGSAAGAHVFANTLSANFRKAGFIFIPEFRIDNADKQIFTRSDGGAKKSTASFLLAAIYSF